MKIAEQSSLEELGKYTQRVWKELKSWIVFNGAAAAALFRALAHPRRIRWKDLFSAMTDCGVNGLPVIVLICFLMGVILGYQSAIQMAKYGADLLLPVLVGCSIVRELGPLIVAIVAAGRSGSAFAAEIGTMKVSEELNALETMGIDPVRFLFVPKLLAMILVLPLLTAAGDFFGILGGYAVGASELDITFENYLRITREWVSLKYLFEGLIKSAVFAVIIAMAGCWRGFRTENDAVAVGRSTTGAVVFSILFIITADAVMAKIFAVIYTNLQTS